MNLCDHESNRGWYRRNSTNIPKRLDNPIFITSRFLNQSDSVTFWHFSTSSAQTSSKSFAVRTDLKVAVDPRCCKPVHVIDRACRTDISLHDVQYHARFLRIVVAQFAVFLTFCCFWWWWCVACGGGCGVVCRNAKY